MHLVQIWTTIKFQKYCTLLFISSQDCVGNIIMSVMTQHSPKHRRKHQSPNFWLVSTNSQLHQISSHHLTDLHRSSCVKEHTGTLRQRHKGSTSHKFLWKRHCSLELWGRPISNGLQSPTQKKEMFESSEDCTQSQDKETTQEKKAPPHTPPPL